MKKNRPDFINKLDQVFQKKSTGILNIYLTAGFPQTGSTTEIMLALQNAGTDILEVGVPYSDPIADGPIIQHSNQQAIQNGITPEMIFEQLRSIKESLKIPVVLMGYLNSALQYGFERFCKDASEAGVSGLILPDMPAYEYEKHYKKILKENSLHFIFLITPETSDKRIDQADQLSSGFIYAVSTSSTTGTIGSEGKKQAFFEKISKFKFNNPVLIGFGIHDKDSFEHACRYANGAIIGSAFISSLKNNPDPAVAARDFVDSILK